jgi:hypothetical protein
MQIEKGVEFGIRIHSEAIGSSNQAGKMEYNNEIGHFR